MQVGRQVGLVVKAEDQKGAPKAPKLGYEMGSQGGVAQDQNILTKPPVCLTLWAPRLDISHI